MEQLQSQLKFIESNLTQFKQALNNNFNYLNNTDKNQKVNEDTSKVDYENPKIQANLTISKDQNLNQNNMSYIMG